MGSGGSTASSHVLAVAHSSQKALIQEKLQKYVDKECLIVTEIFPQDIMQRTEILMQCDAAVVFLDARFQFSHVLLTTLSYLKDARKTIVAIALEEYFEPTGAIGAIAFGYATWSSTSCFEGSSPCFIGNFALPESQSFEIVKSPPNYDVCILYEGEIGLKVAQCLINLQSQGLQMPSNSIVLDGSQINALEIALQSKIIICVLTDTSQEAIEYRKVMEINFIAKKCLVPINSSSATYLPSWLALIFAGRLWYSVPPSNLDQIHTKYAEMQGSANVVSDTCTATDLLAHIQTFLTNECTLFADEETRLSMYEEAVLQDRQAMSGVVLENNDSRWIPEDTLAPLDLSALLPDPTATGMIVQEINYKVARLNFEPPAPVVDDNGIAIRGLKLDAMLSYAWKQQAPVLELYQQCRMAHFNVWMDVMGYMKGNIYTAMAAAVENAACLVVYLSTAYTTSINCRLEFQYAVHCKVPMLFLVHDDFDTTHLPSWIEAALETSSLPVYPEKGQKNIFALRLSMENAHNILFSAIRLLSAQRAAAPAKVCRDGTLKLAVLTQRYRALLASQQKDSSFPQCTRCKVNFNPAAPDGCRKHAAYYVGGTIIAGRWVCCSEPKEDGPGCEATTHISESRTWVCDESYGTFAWSPA